MRTRDFQVSKLEKTNIKSKVGFKLDFNDEIKKTIELLAAFLDSNLEKDYEVDYIDIGKMNIKIKVNDEKKFIFKTVNCTFVTSMIEQRYGNSKIELNFTQLSKKPRYKLVGKYLITNREKINLDILKAIIKGLEEIYE